MPSSRPFLRPSIIFLPIFLKFSKLFLNFSISFCTSGSSLKALSHFFIASAATFALSATQESALAIMLFSNSQSLNLTIISPTEAVTSSTLTSTIPRSLAISFMPNFNAPPVTDEIISITANNPFKVRFSLSAVSSDITNFSERALRPSSKL